MADGREPVVLALTLCDLIYLDPATGKRSLLGLFSVAVGATFPLTLGHMAIHAALTECIGKLLLTLRIVDVNEVRQPVVEVKGDVDSDDPLTVIDLGFVMGPVSFPEPGEYRIQLFCNGTPLMERRLIAMQRPEAGHD